MAATGDEEIETLLSTFNQIYEELKKGMTEIQVLKSKCNAEIKKREALQIACSSLRLDNERLTKLYTKSLNKLADQLEQHTKCRGLEKELKRVSDEHLSKEDSSAASLYNMHNWRKLKSASRNIGRLWNCLNKIMQQRLGTWRLKSENEATINHLCQDLATQKTCIHALTNRLERVPFDVEAKYHHEIWDLKDCLLIEQEEKNELNKKLHNLETEFLFSRTKLAEHQRDLNSNRQVGTLKEKIMKLRKENEVLKRQLLGSKEG